MKKTVAFISILFSCIIGLSAKGIQDLNPFECISYTLTKQEEGIIATARIKDDETVIQIYGNNGELLSTAENLNNTYEIGSLTKTFTAALICKAQKEGKLNIDDTINAYLDLPDSKYYPTIRKLITHTSGYKPYYLEKGMITNHLKNRNDFYGITKQQILERVAKEKVQDKKYDFNYSNFGYAVLGLILESVYNENYTTLVNDFLHNDLGMIHTYIADDSGNLKNYWDWEKDDAYLSAGGLYSTLEDMILYAKLQMEDDNLFAECHSILSEVTNYSKRNSSLGININNICYAWCYDSQNKIYWHNGGTGNYNCYLGFKPETKEAVLVFSNLAPDFKIPATVIGVKEFLQK